MSTTAPRTLTATIWRLVKIFLGAWAFAVAGGIVTSLVLTFAIGPAWSADYLRYAFGALFLVGIPIMQRWLK
jgi:hypothetical protein